MNTIGKILESKGYDLADISEIVESGYRSHTSLDQQVRDEFAMYEPIHLWDTYQIGDADETEMDDLAQEKGYNDFREMLKAMDRKLIELAENFPSKN